MDSARGGGRGKAMNTQSTNAPAGRRTEFVGTFIKASGAARTMRFTTSPDKLAADLVKAGREKVPDYAFDCHTQKGRRMGKTKAEFFRDEQAALEPFQPGLFDDLIDG